MPKTQEAPATEATKSMSCWMQIDIPVDVLKAHGIACGDGKQTTRKVFRAHLENEVLPGYFENLKAAAASKGATVATVVETPEAPEASEATEAPKATEEE